MVATLMLVVAAQLYSQPAVPSSGRKVRWWSSHLGETLDLVYQHRDAITGVAPCCHGPSVFANGSFNPGSLPCLGDGRSYGSDTWAHVFTPLGITVEYYSSLDSAALVSGTADGAISAMVRCVVNTNITGLVFDVESFHGDPGARPQAILYARWLSKLATAMHSAGKTVGVCISDWGMLQYYDLYAAAQLDSMMTMATYYNMAANSSNCSLCPAPIKTWNSREELWRFWLDTPRHQGVAHGVLSAGVGQMTISGCGCKNGTTECCSGVGYPSRCHADPFPAVAGQQCGLTDKLHAARSYGGCHAVGNP